MEEVQVLQPATKKKRTLRDSIRENMLKESGEPGKAQNNVRFNYYCDFVRNGDEKEIALTEDALTKEDNRTQE